MSAYTTLWHHIESKDEVVMVRRLRESHASTSDILPSQCFSAKTLSAPVWLECVITCLQPLNFVEHNLMRSHSSPNPILIDSLQSYIHALMANVQRKCLAMLPDKFSVIFYGWCAGDTNYVAMFPTYTSRQPVGYDPVLLALSPMGK